jgi:hypothetical protein
MRFFSLCSLWPLWLILLSQTCPVRFRTLFCPFPFVPLFPFIPYSLFRPDHTKSTYCEKSSKSSMLGNSVRSLRPN